MEEADSNDEPLFLGKVSCSGSEQGLSEYSHDINTWNCTRVALSCVETLSENYKLIILAKHPTNSMIDDDVDQLKCTNTHPVSSTDDERYVYSPPTFHIAECNCASFHDST